MLRLIGRAVVLLALMAEPTGAVTRYVNLQNPSPLPPYLSWPQAATSIQHAVNVAFAGDTVLVSNGVYAIASEVLVTQGLEVISVNGPSVTTIDGMNTTRCVHITSSNAVLSGFKITRGVHTNGAGIFLKGALVSNCQVVANRARGPSSSVANSNLRGGGISAQGGWIRDCVVHANTNYGASPKGGGVYLEAGAVLEDSRVTANAAKWDVGYAGTTGEGGGIFSDRSLVRRCTVQSNTASGATGGGIAIIAGWVEDSIVEVNSAGPDAGGILAVQTSTVRRTIIRRNGTSPCCGSHASSASSGGARVQNSVIENCVIYGNNVGGTSFSEAGGLLSENSIVRQCTITSNSVNAGGSFIFGYGSGAVIDGGTLINSIVQGNLVGGEDNVRDLELEKGLVSHSCIGTIRALGGTTNIALVTNSPLFTLAISNDFTLSSASPCIDTGTAADMPSEDLVRNPRPLDGNGDAFAVHDMGAYEYLAPTDGLSHGSVGPACGETSTLFAFTVNYQNPAAAPTQTHAVVDGVPYSMTPLSGSVTDGLYNYFTTLASGGHDFFFSFADATGGAYRLPSSGSYTGPFVNGQAMLTAGGVAPEQGTTLSLFHFTVNYTDPTGGDPGNVFLVLDGNSRPLALLSGEPGNGTYSYATGLALGVHSYFFYAFDAAGCKARLPVTGLYSNLEVQAPLPGPGGVTASDGTFADRVRVAWKSVTGAVGYELWCSVTNASNTAVLVAATTNKQADDTSVTVGQLYYYWVKATNAFGSGVFSNPDAGYAAFVPPTNLMASDGAFPDRIRVTWDEVAGAAGYELWRHVLNDSASAGLVSGALDTNTYDDFTIEKGRLFYYWTKTRSAGLPSLFSLPDTGFVVLGPPSGVSASDDTSQDAVDVTWNAVPYATSYEVWWNKISETGSAMRIGMNIPSTAWADTQVAPGQVSLYWLKAVNNLGVSGFSVPDAGLRSGSGPTQEVVDLIPGFSLGVQALLAATDRLYTVEFTDNLTSTWKNALGGAEVPGLGRTFSVTVTNPVEHLLFFRTSSREDP